MKACLDKFKNSNEGEKIGLDINEEGKEKVGETTKDINSDSTKAWTKSFDSLYKGQPPTVSTAPVVSDHIIND
jgi:hypothetical protein